MTLHVIFGVTLRAPAGRHCEVPTHPDWKAPKEAQNVALLIFRNNAGK